MDKKRKAVKYLLRFVILLFISFIFGAKLYRWNSETLVGDAMPMPFGYGVSVVLSGSMEPALSVNDLVVVKKSESYNVGDIVVYQDKKSLIIHRIIETDENTIITKGDANNVPDGKSDISAVKGKLAFRVSGLGIVFMFFKQPLGAFLLIIAAVAVFELPYIKDRKKENDEEEKLKEEIKKIKSELEKL